jgi:formamidopyrimidine-DNA glycosylase
VPELPDITVYVECLERRILTARLDEIRIRNPFVLRSVEPPIETLHGRTVLGIRRIGKRIALEFEDDLFLVIHLMIAGRLQWRAASVPHPRPGKITHAEIQFATGTLVMTEAATRKRASIRVAAGEAALRSIDPGGLEILATPLEEFRERLVSENHTLKRSLTDPRLFSGIGNAYSDEILHDAHLSPVRLSRQLTPGEVGGLRESCIRVLTMWTDRLRTETGDGFPTRVTAFRDGMAVHGRYGQPCPICATPVQRIVYAENETNYCPRCQLNGKLLADRSLSRLLKGDWPRTIEELEEARASRSQDQPELTAQGRTARRTRSKPRSP